MNVYSYYAYIPSWGNQSSILEVWSDSWRRQGWNPVLLTEADAGRHEQWPDFRDRRQFEFKSINPSGYDHACWARWFAFEVAGGGVMVDYDVINLSLRPADINPGSPLILEQHRVPCAVAADTDGAGDITDSIMTHEVKSRDGHYSDMYFFQDSPWHHDRTCREMDQEGWRFSPLVHLSTRACRQAGRDKVQVAKELIGT